MLSGVQEEIRGEQVDTRILFGSRAHEDVDFAEVKGQEHAKRALEIAAAGAHNMFMLYVSRPLPGFDFG